MKKQTNKQRLTQQRRNFLLTFFKNISEYQEKNVNGFWLIKHWDGNFKRWQVDIYTKESYKRMKEGTKKFEQYKVEKTKEENQEKAVQELEEKYQSD